MPERVDPLSINWAELSRTLGIIPESGCACTSEHATVALELIIGRDQIQSAVDLCVTGGLGNELAQMVLRQLRSWPAMQRCYEIYSTTVDVEVMSGCVGLLRHIGDHRVLQWVGEFLSSGHANVQTNAGSLMETLTWHGYIHLDKCQAVLDQMASHTNANVRSSYSTIVKRSAAT